MAIRPDDQEKMRQALGVPDAMAKATGSDVDPDKAARLREKADRDAAADAAEAEREEKR